MITRLRDQQSKFSNSSINYKISKVQIPICSMNTNEALEFVNGSVTTALLHKLSGDNKINEKITKATGKSLPDDDLVIIFEKLRKRRIERKEI